MSFDKPKEFQKKCVGYIDSDMFPNMCYHFCLYGNCSFFLTQEGDNSFCDDLKDKESNARTAHN